jgi:hypothetical protein
LLGVAAGMIGAVVGATVVERIGELSLERVREHVR